MRGGGARPAPGRYGAALRRGVSDFAADPYLICVDRYWRLRLLERPSIRTAAACSLWISAHVSRGARVEVLEKWALGYAFITKDSVESAVGLAQGTEEIVSGDTSAGDVAYFASLYHAGKLRSGFLFEELHRFLDTSLLALAAGTHRQSALFTALRPFAAFGSPAVTAEHAVGLLDQAWHSADRTRHVVAWGAAHALFALLVIGGTWLITGPVGGEGSDGASRMGR
ncbi:hypothetical protein [Streptomyces sp. SID9124]|uniref:hypothetical protein n=1 Tax=Streptomyces sp. SID9124 TaxID=2706108 RepID=UPI0013DFB88D|nr:hypothetical protein [Streptomyces sp. SID9124]NED15820.1 hypothetical protein [Streptomyces sp. SID9124]